MLVSVKVAVAALLVVTCVGVVLVALAPAIVQLEADAMTFVENSCSSSADFIQYSLSSRFRRLESSAEVFYAAAARDNMLAHFNVFKWFDWVAPVIASEDLGVMLVYATGHGFSMTRYNTAVDGSTQSGYVFISNLTSPSRYVDVGAFQLYTHTPANVSHPWTRVESPVSWLNLSLGRAIENPNRTSALQWVEISPLNTFRPGSGSSVLAFGGPVHIQDGSVDVQYLTVSIRGDWLSQYFVSPAAVNAKGTAVVVDTVTKAFVAGSISDPSSVVVNLTARLVTVAELTDVRIKPVLSANAVGVPGGFRDGLSAVMGCALPCSFIYWPHRHELVPEGSSSRALDVLAHRFVAIQVISVTADSDNSPMKLRLIYLVYSEDVISEFVHGARWGIGAPLVFIAGLCVLVVLGVALVFRSLAKVELVIEHMAVVVARNNSNTTVQQEDVSKLVQKKLKSVVKEFDKMFSALRQLGREYAILRAFAPMHVVLPGSMLLLDDSRITPNSVAGPSHNSATPSVKDQDDIMSSGAVSGQLFTIPAVSSRSKPYDVRSLWKVPVTTMVADVAEAFYARPRSRDGKHESAAACDPVVMYQRHGIVLDAVQLAIRHIHGASLDHLFGDRFVLHFNACGRTPEHTLRAVSVAMQVNDEIHARVKAIDTDAPAPTCPLPVVFGIATSIGLCGFFGPTDVKVFTVVAPCEAEAVMMGSVGASNKVPILLSWRAMEMVKHQKQSISKKFVLGSPLHRAATAVYFPLVLVVVPTATTTTSEQTVAFAVDAAAM